MKKIEVEAEMALEAVIMEMKFWDNIFNLPQKGIWCSPHGIQQLADSTLEISGPLATDVI